MNRTELLKKVKEVTGLSDAKMKKIEKILDEHALVGHDNKEKFINAVKKELGMAQKDANELYNQIAGIVGGGAFDKIKGAFADFVDMFKKK